MYFVILANTTLAGVMGKIAQGGPFVHGHNGIGRQGAETHGGNVENGHRIWLRAVGPAHCDTKVAVLWLGGAHGVVDPLVAVAVDVFLGAERAFINSMLGPLV